MTRAIFVKNILVKNKIIPIFAVLKTKNMEINFEKETTNVMPSLVGLLAKRKYRFVSVADGYHSHFYCMIRCDERNNGAWFYRMFKWLGAKKPIPTYDLEPLSLHYYDENGCHNIVPIVFSQEDVRNIIAAVPDSYDGEETL